MAPGHERVGDPLSKRVRVDGNIHSLLTPRPNTVQDSSQPKAIALVHDRGILAPFADLVWVGLAARSSCQEQLAFAVHGPHDGRL
eukprot:50203-Rhodomonas_salina.1